MRPEYVEAMYKDWVKGKSIEEIGDLIDFLVKLLRKKGCTVIGKIEISRGE